MGKSKVDDTGKPGVLLTYDLRVGSDYLKFKEELGGTFHGMRETKLLTTVVWDDADLDVGGLTTYVRSPVRVGNSSPK